MGQHPTSDEPVPAAILFGDMMGSTAEAEADERAAVGKLAEYQDLVRQHAEQFGSSLFKVKHEGDGFMVVFATAHSMVQCGVALQDQFRRRGWRVRMGGHYAEVYRDEAGDVFGTDVNRAARIHNLADASRCQLLVSETVVTIVRDRLPGIRFLPRRPVAVRGVAKKLIIFEVIESSTGWAKRSVSRRSMAMATVLTAALGLGAWMFSSHHAQWRQRLAEVMVQAAPSDQPLTIAVLKFENQRQYDSDNGWYAKALQTSLRTELSKIPQLNVVAQQVIRRLAEQRDVDQLEAARELGIRRLVGGSFAVHEDRIRIDAWIVSAESGLQIHADSVEGEARTFFDLQRSLARATLDNFRVRLSGSQKASLMAPRKSNIERYRMLLEAEGVTRESKEGRERQSQQPPPPAGSLIFPARFAALFLETAHAEQAPAINETEVRHFLERYRSAHEAGDVPGLVSLYVAFPESQREAVEAYVANVRDLSVDLKDVEIDTHDQAVAVSYTRVDSFVDEETDEPITLEVRVTKFLVRQNGDLRFAEDADD